MPRSRTPPEAFWSTRRESMRIQDFSPATLWAVLELLNLGFVTTRDMNRSPEVRYTPLNGAGLHLLFVQFPDLCPSFLEFLESSQVGTSGSGTESNTHQVSGPHRTTDPIVSSPTIGDP